MTYFIIEAQYDQCFEWFFKDEFGYPNFYRLNELLPSQDEYAPLIVLAPNSTHTPHIHKISARVQEKNIKHLSFGEAVSTQFAFDTSGKLRTHPLFQAALDQAVQQFLMRDSAAS